MKPFLVNINEGGENCCKFATILFSLEIDILYKVSIKLSVLNDF